MDGITQCQIIPFPNVEIEKQEPSKSAKETPWELCEKISEELGLSNIKYLRLKILTAISSADIKSIEELARYPLKHWR
jgi:hypothetical protein